MLKKIPLLAILSILVTSNNLTAYAPIDDDFIIKTYSKELTDLDEDKNPNRYEDILIARPVPFEEYQEAQTFMSWFKNEGRQHIYTPEYVLYRANMANAVACGQNDPLFFEAACCKQDLKLIHFLLQHNAAAPNAWTPLHDHPIFCAKSVALIKVFQEFGASLQVRDPGFERTVLHNACHEKYPPEVLEYYIQHAGFDINVPSGTNQYRCTPLHEWAEFSLWNGVKPETVKIALKKLDLLFRAGADHTLLDHKGKTALDRLNEQLAKYERYQVNELREPRLYMRTNWRPQISELKKVIAHFKRTTQQPLQTNEIASNRLTHITQHIIIDE